MGKRVAERRPIESPGQWARVIGGHLLAVVGVLWMMFFVALLLFGGLDLHERVGNTLGFVGPVVLALAIPGFAIAHFGRALAASAQRTTS